VHLADLLVKAADFGHSGDHLVPPVQPLAWELLRMDEKLLGEIVLELEDKLVEVKNFSLEMQESNDTKA